MLLTYCAKFVKIQNAKIPELMCKDLSMISGIFILIASATRAQALFKTCAVFMLT